MRPNTISPLIWPLLALICHKLATCLDDDASDQQVASLMDATTQLEMREIGLNTTDRCNRESVLLARQMLAHQFESLNQYNSIWFNDLDLSEIQENQKQSLANMFLSSSQASNNMTLNGPPGSKLLSGNDQASRMQLLESSANGLPLIEIESSSLRPLSWAPPQQGASSQSRLHKLFMDRPEQIAASRPQNIKHNYINLRLLSEREALNVALNGAQQCQIGPDSSFVYSFGLALGPFEHHLDVIYNLPRELRLSQPIDWRYAQIKLIVPVTVYLATLRQSANYKLNSSKCPTELLDLTYLSSSLSGGVGSTPQQPQVAILAAGMANTNATLLQLQRLFDDYTRPAISRRLRHFLRFHLSSKTLPLAIESF